MARFSAFLDTCVLVPMVPADLLLRLADAGLFRPLWSEIVMAELLDVLGRVHPEYATDGRARNRVKAMNKAFPDARVSGWEQLEQGIRLPDPNDAHVLAAAIAGRADIIVTENLKDFPEAVLDLHGLEAQGLDEFLLNQLDLMPDATIRALHEQAQATRRPPLTTGELLASLRRANATKFADAAFGQLWRAPAQLPRRRGDSGW